jgi:hypothetical protein
VVKAHSVIRRHAERLKISREDPVTIYGWDPQILAQDAEHQYAGRCNYCHEPYIELADITLDIQDRRRKPRRLRSSSSASSTSARASSSSTGRASAAQRALMNTPLSLTKFNYDQDHRHELGRNGRQEARRQGFRPAPPNHVATQHISALSLEVHCLHTTVGVHGIPLQMRFG